MALISLVIGFGWLGTRGLGEPDETRYALVAHEMLQSGQWSVPTLHQAPHFSKPPLTYWMVASGQAVFGPSGWGSRLFLGVVFALTVLLVARFGQDLWGEPAGRWAGIVYATTLSPFVAASLITTDTLLVLWETAAMWAFWRSWDATSRLSRTLWHLTAWGCLGGAFLTKGPPGLLPVLVVVVVGLLRPADEPRRRVFSLSGLALFALVALPWYAVVAAAYPGLLEHFLGHEIYQRAVVGVERRHSGWLDPLVIYGPVLIPGSLPWLALAAFVPRRLTGLAGRVRWRRSLRARCLAVWIVLPVVVFTLASSRMYLYVLPIFPPLALACTGVCLRLGRGRFLRTSRAGVVVSVAAIALLGLRITAAHYPSHRDAELLAAPLAAVAGPEAALVAVGRPLHGFDLTLGTLGSVAGRGAPPVDGACRTPGVEESVDSLTRTERRRIYVADGDALRRLEQRIVRAEATGRVRCQAPFGPTRAKAIVCDPLPGPDARPRIAVLLDAARSGGGVHALSCLLRRVNGVERFETLYVISDRAARTSWRRRLLPSDLEDLLWWLEDRGTGVRRLEPGRGRFWNASGDRLTISTKPIAASSSSYRLSVLPGRHPGGVRHVHLTPGQPLALIAWDRSEKSATVYRADANGQLRRLGGETSEGEVNPPAAIE